MWLNPHLPIYSYLRTCLLVLKLNTLCTVIRMFNCCSKPVFGNIQIIKHTYAHLQTKYTKIHVKKWQIYIILWSVIFEETDWFQIFSLREKCPIFAGRIWTEWEGLLCKSPYSDQIWEYKNQKKLCICTPFA